MSDIKEQIITALKKLGPVSPGQLADHLQLEQSRLGYHVKALLDAGTIKAAGVTAGRRLALPEQKIEDATGAPPQRRKKAKKAAAKKSKRKAPKPRAPEASPAARAFIAAITADSRILLVNGGAPQLLSEEESEQIAELCFAHFEE